jgi:hypothetical protein
MNGKPKSFIKSDVNVFVMQGNMASVLNVPDLSCCRKEQRTALKQYNNAVMAQAHKAPSK